MVEVSVIAAFLAGIISFLSPCIFPLVPGFLGYLAGINLNDTSKIAKLKLLTNSIIFVVGFSTVFALLGVLLNTTLANVSVSVQKWLSRIGGLIIILFGLYIMKVIKIPFLEREHKIKLIGLQPSYLTSFLFGSAFAVGWTPCVGAILGSILTLSLTNPGQSFYLLLSYSIGLGIPFILVGIFSTNAISFITRNQLVFKYFNIIVGILILVLGILVFTNQLSRVSSFTFPSFFLNLE